MFKYDIPPNSTTGTWTYTTYLPDITIKVDLTKPIHESEDLLIIAKKFLSEILTEEEHNILKIIINKLEEAQNV